MKFKNKLSSFEDLTKPEFSNLIVHADPSQSSTALALVSGLWQLDGGNGAFYSKLADNGLFLAKKK